jgi:hypothetical protein
VYKAYKALVYKALVYKDYKVSCVQGLQGSRVHIGMFAQQFISNDNIGHEQTPTCTVPLSSDQITVISNLIPTNAHLCSLSTKKGNATVLPMQSAVLDKNNNLLRDITPSLRLKILFKSAPQIQMQANTDIPTANITKARVTHLFTVCVPLKELLPQLSTHGFHSTQVVTSEDNNTTWHLRMSLADENLMQQMYFHESMVQQLVGQERLGPSYFFIPLVLGPKQPRMVRTFLKVHTRPRLANALWCRGY